MKKQVAAAVVGSVAALAASQASAGLLVYEPFDYTVGDPIAGKTPSNVYQVPNTGNTWQSAGTVGSTRHQIASGSLVPPPGFPSSGPPNTIGNSGLLKAVDRTELNRLDLPTTYGVNSTLYYSLLLQISDLTGLTTPNTNANANNDGIIMFNNGIGSQPGRPSNWAGELVIRLGSAGGTYNLGIRASSTPNVTVSVPNPPGKTYWTGDITANSDTHLVVVRYVQGANGGGDSSDDSNDLWLDPAAASYGVVEGSQPSPNGSSFGSINQANPILNSVTSLMVGSGIAVGSNPNDVFVDEVRVGDTWADVTQLPEPTALAALGIGALGLLRRRRSA
jgi:MYXO-CTERM domain-containing protein